MKNKLWGTAVAFLLLAGCQTEKPLETSSEVSTDMVSSEETQTVDSRFVPEWNQVETALHGVDGLTLGAQYFDLQSSLKQEQQAFDVVVEQMQVLEVTHAENDWMDEFAFESKPGAIIAMHVAITNHSDAVMYFPIEELRLSFDDATSKIAPSTDLYPLDSGNLAEILMENKGEIAPETTVDGYLIYGVGSTSWQKMKALGNFYVSVVPPRASLSELIGVGANKLGEIQSFFLPLDTQTERQLNENNQFVQERLTTEWWGIKHVLAEGILNQTHSQENVSVTLKRVEITDFEPRMKYEEAFQNFAFGQILVSIEYEVTNNGTKTLLPVDAEAQLQIGDDNIYSDYVLTNQTYGHEVAPGETYTVIKSFALDKKRYQLAWQNQPMKWMLQIPIEADEAAANSASESTEELEQAQPFKHEIIVEFDWQPQLTQWIDEALKRTTNNPTSTESRSSESDSALTSSES